MTADIERFIELYTSVGIPIGPPMSAAEHGMNRHFPECTQFLVLSEGGHDFASTPMVRGHSGFYTILYFDQSGKFLGQGIWE